jgi:hypothetical protein
MPGVPVFHDAVPICYGHVIRRIVTGVFRMFRSYGYVIEKIVEVGIGMRIPDMLHISVIIFILAVIEF